MKALSQLVVVVVLASLVCSCNLFDSGTSWRSGRFQVEWIDTAPNSYLAYRLNSGDSIGIVEACVFAAGANEHFVVVEQRPASQATAVNYYVLPTAGFNPLYPQEHLVGPLAESAYHAMAKRLSLPAVGRVVAHGTCSASAR